MLITRLVCSLGAYCSSCCFIVLFVLVLVNNPLGVCVWYFLYGVCCVGVVIVLCLCVLITCLVCLFGVFCLLCVVCCLGVVLNFANNKFGVCVCLFVCCLSVCA